jgi:putative oxidoreductase
MTTKLLRHRVSTPAAAIAVRLGVGGIFFFEGVKKFLFPADWGVGRFLKIGIPAPHVMAPFVGTVEVVCGALLIIGLMTQLAAVPLLIDISVAILSTKIPLLLTKGFWPMEAEARTDYAMLTGLLFLLLAGGGPWSIDAWRSRASNKTYQQIAPEDR